MESCMICGRSGYGKLFNVNEPSNERKNLSVKQDMLEIFGDEVVPYLKKDDQVCRGCMNLLENFSILRRRIWLAISRNASIRTPIDLGKIWTLFASLNLGEDLLGEEDPEEAAALPRVPTPNLMQFSHSVPYDSDDDGIEDGRRTLTKRRKRKGHHWTRVKRRGQYRSRSRSRSRLSPTSDYTSYSCATTNSRPASAFSTAFSVASGRHSRRRRKRTVSSSKREREWERDYQRKISSSRVLYFQDCSRCKEGFTDLDLLTNHRVNFHKIRDLYICPECGNRYTLSEHLEIHNETHDTLPMFCPMCGDQLPNTTCLQVHLTEHLLHSFPCRYESCDKSFLSEDLLHSHTETSHIMRERLRRHRKLEPGFSLELNSDWKKKNYEVLVRSYANVACEEDDLDVTAENLRLSNFEVYMEMGYERDREYVDGSDSEILTNSEGKSKHSDSSLIMMMVNNGEPQASSENHGDSQQGTNSNGVDADENGSSGAICDNSVKAILDRVMVTAKKFKGTVHNGSKNNNCNLKVNETIKNNLVGSATELCSSEEIVTNGTVEVMSAAEVTSES